MFNYLIDKINDAPFIEEPFRFVYLENFLSDAHLDIVLNDPQIKFPEFPSVEGMIEYLRYQGYKPQPFPGCTTDENAYIKWASTGDGDKPSHAHGLIEGFGMAYRMQSYRNIFLEDLMTFLNSKEFLFAIRDKFGISNDVYVETAIQKYLTGYEISPHPDIRKKALTYMLNINPRPVEGCGTYFMKFKPEWEHIYDFWKSESQVDRCWVPWDWCDNVFTQLENNSITIFAPGDKSLHAVKLNYEHLKTQRTQVYGNLWWNNKPKVAPLTWQHFAQ
jgi:hypothetical protein